jgi:hypothetical protein
LLEKDKNILNIKLDADFSKNLEEYISKNVDMKERLERYNKSQEITKNMLKQY